MLVKRRMCCRRPIFSMSSLAISSLGIVVWFPLRSRRRVERNPISSTMPSWPFTTIRCPILYGLSSKIMMLPIKFFSVSCDARAMARPPTPRPASSVLMLKPILSSHSNTAMTITNMFNIFFTGRKRMVIDSCPLFRNRSAHTLKVKLPIAIVVHVNPMMTSVPACIMARTEAEGPM